MTPPRTDTAERQWLLALARDGGDRHFDPTTGLCLTSRDTCWYAIALLFDPDPKRREFGNQLLTTIWSEDGTHTPATMLAILHAIPDRLNDLAVAHLQNEIRSELVHAAETEWNDGNLNHPLGAYCTLVLGGEFAGNSDAVELGTRRLRRLLDRASNHRSVRLRQAEVSEYHSLTYTALSICFLALIAEYASRDDARRIALELEDGLWLSTALHFHAPSHQFAGPHSRSYHEDSVGGFSALHALYSAAGLGPLYMNSGLSVRFNHPSNHLQNALSAITPFHVSPRVRTIALEKPFPYSFSRLTYGESYHENGPGRFDEEVYPGGWSLLTTYLTEDYALGSASLPYVNAGHADSVMLRIRRTTPVTGMGDFRSMYTRGVFNGAAPGVRNLCHTTSTEIDESYQYEEGRCGTYQHENRLIACYAPKRAGHRGVTSFRVDIIFGYHAPFDELLVDGVPLSGFPVRATAGSRILIRDGATYLLILPLTPDPAVSQTPVLLRQVNEFFLISLLNYEGPACDLSRDAINRWRSGFVLEAASERRFGNWREFVSYASGATVRERLDDWGRRRIVFESGGHSMEFTYDPVRESIVSRKWDGEADTVDHFRVSAPASSDDSVLPTAIFSSPRA